VARLYAAGWQPVEIAKRFGITVDTVYSHACHYRRKAGGLIKPYAGAPRELNYNAIARMVREGVPQVEIARRLNCTTSGVSTALRKMREAGALVPPKREHAPPIKWTPELTVKAARIAAEQGLRAAAAAVGTTHRAVNQHMKRHRISIRRIRERAEQARVEAL
jgi:DNA-binding CsgD family transcriptional regulator